MYMKIIQMK